MLRLVAVAVCSLARSAWHLPKLGRTALSSCSIKLTQLPGTAGKAGYFRVRTTGSHPCQATASLTAFVVIQVAQVRPPHCQRRQARSRQRRVCCTQGCRATWCSHLGGEARARGQLLLQQ